MDFYGTIGPACGQLETLQRMVEAGMTGIRMNLSHGPLTAHADWLAMIRAAGIRPRLIASAGQSARAQWNTNNKNRRVFTERGARTGLPLAGSMCSHPPTICAHQAPLAPKPSMR